MPDANKLIASVEEYLDWPYVFPCTNGSRGIDCSGLFVKAYRDQGASIYHGSTTIYRKNCSEKGRLTSVSQLNPRMAVFKWNGNTPEKFNDGLGDFQYIGLVNSVSPLRIVHAATGTICVITDTSLGNWKYWGWLKDVAKEGSLPTEQTVGDEGPVTETDCTTVIADSGSAVNIRTKAKASAPLAERVPLGARVELLGTCGSWTRYISALGPVI